MPPAAPRTAPHRQAWRHPLATLRARWQRWWLARLPRSDSLTLTQGNVYILPTRAGLMLAGTLLLLLIASINYQLNLGYLLTFLLGGSAIVSIHMSHATLRGLNLVLHPAPPHHADTPTRLRITLHNPGRTPRYGIGLRLYTGNQQGWIWCDMPRQGSVDVEILVPDLPRGQHELPTLTAETRFPLGIFRIWTLWRPASKTWVYPQAERSPPPLPAGPRQGRDDDTTPTPAPIRARPPDSPEFDGVRAYRPGDPLKNIVWKKVAKSDALVSRNSEPPRHHRLWLDLSETHGATLEQRLSRLCAWVLMAQERGMDYGLRLPGLQLAPAQGDAHKQQCLQALALY